MCWLWTSIFDNYFFLMAAPRYDWPPLNPRPDPTRVQDGKKAINQAIEDALELFRRRPWQNSAFVAVHFPAYLSDDDKQELLKYSGYRLGSNTFGTYERMKSFLNWPWAGFVYLEVEKPKATIYRQRHVA